MKPIITWILVADGARARVLLHRGPGHGLSAVEGMDFAQEPLQAREIMADRPGREYSSVGHRRSAMEPQTDPVKQREADFVKRLADMLDAQLKAGAFDRLVLVAAPVALGDLRASLSPALRGIVHAELAKDLTQVPNNEMGKHLDGVLAI